MNNTSSQCSQNAGSLAKSSPRASSQVQLSTSATPTLLSSGDLRFAITIPQPQECYQSLGQSGFTVLKKHGLDQVKVQDGDSGTSRDEEITQDGQNWQLYKYTGLYENGDVGDWRRISANSNVNFMFLNKREQEARYKNMLREHRALKKKLHEMEEKSFQKWTQLGRPKPLVAMTPQLQQLSNARNMLQNEEFELDDCKGLIQNLAMLLKTRKMATGSQEFKLLCALVKRVAEPEAERDQELRTWEREVLSSEVQVTEFFTGHSSQEKPKKYQKVFNIERPVSYGTK